MCVEKLDAYPENTCVDASKEVDKTAPKGKPADYAGSSFSSVKSSALREEDYLADLRTQQEAVEIASKIISIDSSNYGDGSGPGERECAEYVCNLFDEVNLKYEYVESETKRANVLARIEGSDPSLPPLMLHGHLDVVPAEASEWSVNPFAGEIDEGILYGRGAVDMKNMDGMIIAITRQILRSGYTPRRTLIIGMIADEEHGGYKGAHWLVDHRREWIEGVTEAISEVGGYSVDVNGHPVYIVQTAEKGIAWLNIIAKGRAGHGSQINTDNAVKHLTEAILRIANYPWPLNLTPTVKQILAGVADLTGIKFDPEDENTFSALLDALGSARRFVEATLRTNANLTQLKSGYKVNVIPSTAQGSVDIRYLPGEKNFVWEKVNELAGSKVEIQPVNRDVALEVPFSGQLVDQMVSALKAEDPQAVAIPYMLSGGSDAKGISRLGIKGYGFAPIKLPKNFDFAGMFHGIDERVPVESIHFGVRVIARLIRSL